MPFDGLPGSLLARPAGAIPQGRPLLDPNAAINAALADVWPMAEGGGAALRDLGPRGLDAAPAAAPLWVATPYGRAIDTSGGSYWMTATVASPSLDSVSVFVTACATGTLSPNHGLISNRDGTGTAWVFLGPGGASGNPLTGATVNNSSAERNAVTGLTITLGLPFAAALVTTPTAMHVWMWDAVHGLRTFTLGETIAAGALSNPWYLGTDGHAPGARYWPGWLFAPRIYYNRALTITDFLAYARDPRFGLVYPSDRPWQRAAATGGGVSVTAQAALPSEWLLGGTAPMVSAARLLTSGGRIRILATPGRRRLLASRGRVRILQIIDR